MKLQEIIEMFGQFGYEEPYIRQVLAQGDSAFNAFEALKTSLQLKWGDMCQELSVDRQKELKPIYERLMKIHMKSRTTAAQKKAETKAKVRHSADSFLEQIEARRRKNVRDVVSMTRDILLKDKAAGKLTPEAEARAKRSGMMLEDD